MFECSAVRRIERTSAGVPAITRGGAVEAKHVVIATGYAMREFTPLSARFEMKHTYVLATRPITARIRRKLGLRDLLLWDADDPITTPDGLVAVSSWAGLIGRSCPRVDEHER